MGPKRTLRYASRLTIDLRNPPAPLREGPRHAFIAFVGSAGSSYPELSGVEFDVSWG